MLKEIIDKYYLDRERDKKNKTQTSFYISEAGKCPRSIFFKFKNVFKKDLEPNILRLFEYGDKIHQSIMNSLISSTDIRVVSSEINIPPQQLVRGRIDAILSDGKELYVLDIKSMNSMIFRGLEEPKEENILQVQLYLHYFQIKKGILLYVNKDNLNLKEYFIEYDPIKVSSLLDNLTILKKQIDSDIIPARITGYPDDWQCRYCQFKDTCVSAGSAESGWNQFKNNLV
jgi:CRISPR/Cas system-associated exonuclease Cas4 (RecB family)